jgi:2-phosphosulfolactate phosphatase
VETPLGNCRIITGREGAESVLTQETPVVVDTLRAASTIVTALSCGVEEIIPVVSDEEAFRLRDQGMAIAGETGGVKLPGYDLGNSPVELLQRMEQKPFKSLVFKTSNLVPLLLKLSRAWICSSLNLAAVASQVMGNDVAIVAAGGEHGIAEDLAVAIALHARLSNAPFDEQLITCFIRESLAAGHLCTLGFNDDVQFISRVNIYTVVPYYDGQKITIASDSSCR